MNIFIVSILAHQQGKQSGHKFTNKSETYSARRENGRRG